MLFLAVSAGFLAENIRENRGDNAKEHAYMTSFYNDLKSDTAGYNHTIVVLHRKIPFYDSALKFLTSPGDFNYNFPFRFYIKTNSDVSFMPIEPTFQQLRNSGNLRLITNNLVLDSCQIYEGIVSGDYQGQVNYVIEFNKRLLQMQEKLFEYSNLNKFLNDKISSSVSEDGSIYSILLISKDNDKMQELRNLFIGTKAAEIFYISHLEFIKQKAINLMVFISKEYKL